MTAWTPLLLLPALLGACAGPQSPLMGLIAPAPAAAGAEPPTLAEARARLADPALAWPAKRTLWTRAAAAGLAGPLLAGAAAAAAMEPPAAQALVDLANLKVLALLDGGGAPGRARLAAAADRLYARALELEPGHWEARFQKAVALTFWPRIAGRRAEARAGLERLVADQEPRPPEPRHAWAYLFLGELLASEGRWPEARRVWARGLARHPGEARLQEKLGQPELAPASGSAQTDLPPP